MKIVNKIHKVQTTV